MVLFSRKAIKTLHETVAFYQLAEKFALPPGSGNQMTFNGWRAIAAASSTLAEASANSAVNLSSRKVNVTIQSWGKHAKITDLAEATSIISPVEGAVRELTQSAKLTLDNVVQMAVFKGTALGPSQVGKGADVKALLLSTTWQTALASAFCANTGTFTNSRQMGFPAVFGSSATRLSAQTTVSVSSTPGPIVIRKMVTRLKRLSVDPMPNGAYVGVAHPNWIAGLYANPLYRTLVTGGDMLPRESYFKSLPSHRIHGVELVESANVPRYATSALSCTPLFVCGQGALGVVELGGSGFNIIIKRPDGSTTSDPYNLHMTVAYKMRTVAAVLNPSCGVLGFVNEAL